MTEHKSFKRLVRARMAKTGESYTAARAMLLRGEEPAGAAEVRLATSDETIRERTGRGWEEWFGMLDEWGAAGRSHRETARWLAEQQGLHPLAWNVQAVASSYERARGLREPGEKNDGFAITASKTVGVPVERLYDAFVDDSLRTDWLPDGQLSARTATSRGPLGSTGARARHESMSPSSPKARTRARSHSSTGEWPVPTRRSE